MIITKRSDRFLNLQKAKKPSFEDISIESKESEENKNKKEDSSDPAPAPTLTVRQPTQFPVNSGSNKLAAINALPSTVNSSTSVAPRQRPRGTTSKTTSALPPLPSPSQPKATMSNNPFVANFKEAPPAAAAVGDLTKNPFCSSFIPPPGSSPFNGPKSLPQGPQGQQPSDNGPMSLHNNNKNWNPFEDMKNFAEMTEDALVDEEFDQLSRDNERKPKDPFQSAPFAVKQ